MVISRSGPTSSRRCDYMATAAKPPPPHASSATSTHPSCATPTTTTTKRQHQPPPPQHQRGIAQSQHHQSSLHDFSFPVLAWGRQRLLRCSKVPPDRSEGAGVLGSGGNVSRAGGAVNDRRFAAPPPGPPRTKVVKAKDEGLEKIRAKLMGELREAAGRMELKARAVAAPVGRRPGAPPAWDEEEEEEDDEDDEEEEEEEDDEEYPVPAPTTTTVAPVPPPPASSTTPPEEVKPWKMRTRRSTYKHARSSEPRKRRRDSSPSSVVSSPHRASPSTAAANPGLPLHVPVAPPPPLRSLRSRSLAPPTPEDQDPAADEEDHQQRAAAPRRPRQQPSRQPQQQRRRKPFSVTLSKEEIEEDVYALTGRRASRRPKKRPRALRRQLDMLVPGYYLSEVTLGQYDVREPARES